MVGVVLLTGCDAPTRPQHTERLRSLNLSGTLQSDAFVMRAAVAYPSDDGGPLRLGAPTLGEIDQLRIDGSPRSSSGPTVDVDPQGRLPDIQWRLVGAVEQYADGIIVTLPVWTPPQGVSDDDKRRSNRFAVVARRRWAKFGGTAHRPRT